jgi:hypothetical protein
MDVLRGAWVREGGRLLVAGLPDVVGRFSPPLDSLPQDLWVDRQIKEYVPSRYLFGVSRPSTYSSHDALPDPSNAVALLPARAAEVLGARQSTQLEGIIAGTCFEVTRGEAGVLVDEFNPSGWTFDVTQPVPMTVNISIWALLPHGVPAIWRG